MWLFFFSKYQRFEEENWFNPMLLLSILMMNTIFGPCLWNGVQDRCMSINPIKFHFPDNKLESKNAFFSLHWDENQQYPLYFVIYWPFLSSTSATQADVSVYKAFQKEYPALTRWLNHIASFTEEFEQLPAGEVPASKEAPAAADDEDDVDLFGSDDDEVDEEAEKLKQQRLADYAAKKAAKGPKPAAKSMVSLDVKPWDDETDLEQMLANVKSIEVDGLVWGAHQWVPVGFGIKKLQINLVIEDDKVSLTDLQASIEEDEDHVQSTDVVAMSKI